MLVLVAHCLLPLIFCLGMIRVQTGSRLHFGLFNLPFDEEGGKSSGRAGTMPRYYGGAGMMIEAPEIAIISAPASQWSAEGPLAERALAFAREMERALPNVTIPSQHLRIEACPPEHMGLGTGTQLGLAVARALSTACGLPEFTPPQLACSVGRGTRSALGTHGFAHGGFLIEAGKRRAHEISPLVSRVSVPETWRIVLVLRLDERGLHGAQEREAFQKLQNADRANSARDALCRLVLLEMLPALLETDLKAFGEAVHEFNRQAGIIFASVQQGPYADARAAEVIEYIRAQGIAGAGQSSWGPTVFALAESQEQADWLAIRIRQQFGLPKNEVLTTPPSNHGAEVFLL